MSFSTCSIYSTTPIKQLTHYSLLKIHWNGKLLLAFGLVFSWHVYLSSKFGRNLSFGINHKFLPLFWVQPAQRRWILVMCQRHTFRAPFSNFLLWFSVFCLSLQTFVHLSKAWTVSLNVLSHFTKHKFYENRPSRTFIGKSLKILNWNS